MWLNDSRMSTSTRGVNFGGVVAARVFQSTMFGKGRRGKEAFIFDVRYA